eukprot:TRINITY_DN8122_c0_g1_i1.p1 TRINITY_DN8122_c0_g1~~TRINITY_DN8122_c0_g1_i1.p1  ORF type:complete len:171 (-),score=31.74 TRINITY_DN8122_c0_g1_i1:489-1001(-)
MNSIQSSFLLSLPREILVTILFYLPAHSLLMCARVNLFLNHQVGSNEKLWRHQLSCLLNDDIALQVYDEMFQLENDLQNDVQKFYLKIYQREQAKRLSPVTSQQKMEILSVLKNNLPARIHLMVVSNSGINVADLITMYVYQQHHPQNQEMQETKQVFFGSEPITPRICF